MALTVAITDYAVVGNKYQVTGTLAFDASYPSGGESLTEAMLGMALIDHIQISSNNGYIYEYDYTNKKVKVMCPSGGAAPTSIAAPSVAVPAGGTTVTSSAAQPDLTETGGQGVEMGDTADLSAITGVRFVATGV